MNPAATPEISIEHLAEAVSDGAVVVDVRKAYSVAGGTSGWARSGRAVASGPAPRA